MILNEVPSRIPTPSRVFKPAQRRWICWPDQVEHDGKAQPEEFRDTFDYVPLVFVEIND